MSDQPATPELDRRSAILDQAHEFGHFLDWLNGQGIVLARWQTTFFDHNDVEHVRSEPILEPWTEPYENLLARRFGIDLAVVEDERRALLEYLRSRP